MQDGDDLSVPPAFSKSFYRLLSKLAVEFNLSRPQLALKALRTFAKEERKEKAPFHKALGSKELADRLTEAASVSARDWWDTVPKAEKSARARRAAEARWGAAKKVKK